MEVKIFELRDTETFIVLLAIRLGNRNEEERWLLGRAGFGRTHEQQQYYVITIPLHDLGRTQYDAFKYGDRTYKTAHRYIQSHWYELESGQVIDVEWILGERDTPKESERYD